MTEGGKEQLEVVEEEGKRLIKCPHCGALVEKFIQYENMTVPLCPECRKIVPSSRIPEPKNQWIQMLPAKKKKRKKKVVEIEEPEHEERRETIAPSPIRDESIFKRPKSPDQVLKEVLEQFGLNPKFIQLMVSRSRRIGGIHPSELYMYLITLNSGVKNKNEAYFIAQEYMYALMEEEKKAQELGFPISYPLEAGLSTHGTEPPPAFGIGLDFRSSHESQFPAFGRLRRDFRRDETTAFNSFQRQQQFVPPATAQQSQPVRTMTPVSERPRTSERLTKEEVEKMFEERLKRLLEETKRKEEIDALKESIHKLKEDQIKIQTEFQSALKDIVNSLKDLVNQQVSAVKNEVSNVLTKIVDKINDISKKSDSEEITLDKIKSLMLEDRMNDLVQQLERERQFWQQQLQREKEWYERLMQEREKEKSAEDKTSQMLKELLDEWRKDRYEFLRAIAEKTSAPPPSPDYKDDAIRLLADSVRYATDIMKTKEPMKILFQGLPTLLSLSSMPSQPVQPPRIETKEAESKVPDLLSGTEFVAEE